MTTKRTPLRRGARARITPELVALWRRLQKIEESDGHVEFEPVGRRNEYLDALHALDRALGIRPWGESPVSAVSPEPPAWMRDNPHSVEDWRKAWDLRQELEAAAR